MREDDARTGILQRDKKSYAIVPRLPVGVVTPDMLEAVARVARAHGLTVKITSGQRLALIGMTEDQVPAVWEELGARAGHPVGLCVHYVQACPGIDFCRYGLQGSLAMGTRLEQIHAGVDLPAKTKIGVSGCPLNCAEAWVRDVGLFGTKKGWKVVVGGNSGNKPRIGDLVASGLGDDEAVSLVQKIFEVFRQGAKSKERMPRFVERIGIDELGRLALGDAAATTADEES